MILNGDCIEEMQKLIDDGVQVDSVVTDPPYELGFMGRSWDSTGIAFQATSSQTASRAWRIRNDDMAWGSLDFTVGDSNSDFGDSAADVVMALTKDRRVGIGTTSPGALLEIEGDTNSDTFEHLTLRSTVDGNPSRVNMFFESGQGQLAKIEAEQRA